VFTDEAGHARKEGLDCFCTEEEARKIRVLTAANWSKDLAEDVKGDIMGEDAFDVLVRLFARSNRAPKNGCDSTPLSRVEAVRFLRRERIALKKIHERAMEALNDRDTTLELYETTLASSIRHLNKCTVSPAIDDKEGPVFELSQGEARDMKTPESDDESNTIVGSQFSLGDDDDDVMSEVEEEGELVRHIAYVECVVSTCNCSGRFGGEMHQICKK
jgi:hypothetical protein